MMQKRLMIFAGATLAVASAAHAAVIDTYTRADGATVTDSVGQTEVGGFTYVERGNTAAATTPIGTAEVVNNELKINGRAGTGSNDTGGVFLSGYTSADVTFSADVRFTHSIAAPGSTEELANTFFLALRSQSAMNFGTSASDDGLLAVEFGPNGDVLVRENRGGTLSNVVSANLITGSGTTRRRLAPGALPATFGSGAFDTDQDGFIDDSESFEFAVELSGTLLKLFVNGQQIGTDYTLQRTAGLNGDGVGLHKNRVSAAFETASDVFLDNVDLSPVPEPASLGIIAAGAGLLLARRRRA